MSKLGKLNNCRSQQLNEVEHVEAHRNEKERQHMSLSEHVIIESNEKADELAKEETIKDGCSMTQKRTRTIQQGREEVRAVFKCAVSFHCLEE